MNENQEPTNQQENQPTEEPTEAPERYEDRVNAAIIGIIDSSED